jgi:hypothetical protein
MRKASTPVRYDAPATIHRWFTPEDRAVRAGDVVRAAVVFEGTLAECVREFLAMPTDEQFLHEIFTDTQDGLVRSILGPDDIRKVAARDDFPAD